MTAVMLSISVTKFLTKFLGNVQVRYTVHICSGGYVIAL